MKRTIWLIALLLLVLFPAGCGKQPTGWSLYNPEGELVLQVLEDRDSPVVPAMEQAAEDLTDETGVPIRLLFSENSRDYSVVALEITDVLDTQTISGAISGRNFPHLVTAMFLYQYNGIPILSLGSCEESVLNGGNTCLLSDACSAENVAKAMAARLSEQSCSRAAICYSRTAFETDVVRYLARELEKAEIELVSLVSTENIGCSPAVTAEEWNLLGADILCAVCDGDDGFPALYEKLRDSGLAVPVILADDGISDTLTEREAAALEGAVFVPEYPVSESSARSDAEQQAYDAVYLLGSALIGSGTTGDSAVASLKEGQRYLENGSLNPEGMALRQMKQGILIPVGKER